MVIGRVTFKIPGISFNWIVTSYYGIPTCRITHMLNTVNRAFSIPSNSL